MSVGRILAGIGSGAALAAVATAAIGGEGDFSMPGLQVGLLMVLFLALGCLLRIRRSGSHWAPADSPPVRRLQEHPELLVAYHSLTDSLVAIADNSDGILRDAMIVKLATIQEEMRILASSS
jgi:hypothetical protein